MFKRWKYHFENQITKSSNFVIFLLSSAAIIAVLMVMLEILLGVSSDANFGDHWWNSLTEIINIGKGANFEERTLNFIYWALKVAISGTIIAFLTAKVSGFIARLNTGRSHIIDEGHYVVLGWNSNLFKIFSEIAIANENQAKPTIVCMNGMSNSDIRSKIDVEYPDQKGLRILTRSGDISSVSELAIVNPANAKSVIILDDTVEKAFNVETTILAVRKLLSNANVPIVAQFDNDENIDLLSSLKGSPILPVNKDSIIATITSQAIRNAHVTEVVMDFMDFDGDEVYFFPSERLAGKSFKQALVELQNISLIGLRFADGQIVLNPDKNRIIEANDELIVVAQDDDFDFKLGRSAAQDAAINEVTLTEESIDFRESSSMLVLGWSSVGQDIIDNLLPFLKSNSKITVFYKSSWVKSAPDFSHAPASMTIELVAQDKVDMTAFKSHLKEHRVDTALVLGYNDVLDANHADTHALMQNLHLNIAADDHELNAQLRVILQLNDGAKKSLISGMDRNEFIVSDELSSLLMTQLAENPGLNRVFKELFSRHGAKINVVPFTAYKASEQGLKQYWQLILACLQLNHTCIGYIESGQLHLNPPKDKLLNNPKGLQAVVIH